MRLLVVTNDFPPRPGGIQQYLANLVGSYPSEVAVLAPSDPGAYDDPPFVERGPRRFMWPTPRVARWVLGAARSFRPDALLFGAPYPLPYMIKELRGHLDVPMGVLCHGAEVTLPAAFPVTRGLLKRSLRRADAVFAVSRFTAGRVARLTGRPVTYVGGAVDTEAFTPPHRPVRTPVIGCVSRFVPRKRHDVLIDAAADLIARGRDVELLLVGRGRLEGRLRSQARRRGVPVRFEVGVPWDALPGLYAEMDIFCMPCRSRWGGLEVEGLGLVYLEAAAAGLPVLAGTSGGAPETVVPGVTGYVVADTAAIVEGVERILDDPRLAASMGASGRARVEADFTWDAVVGRLVDGFRGAGEGRP